MPGLDLNRGVKTRFHPTAGISINMYLDDPGTYYDESGKTIDPKIAAQAGFDIRKFAQLRLKMDRLAAYEKKLNEEMKSEEDRLADALSEGGDYDVRHIGANQYALFDKTGVKVSDKPMTAEDVKLLIGVDPRAPKLDEAPKVPVLTPVSAPTG